MPLFLATISIHDRCARNRRCRGVCRCCRVAAAMAGRVDDALQAGAEELMSERAAVLADGASIRWADYERCVAVALYASVRVCCFAPWRS